MNLCSAKEGTVAVFTVYRGNNCLAAYLHRLLILPHLHSILCKDTKFTMGRSSTPMTHQFKNQATQKLTTKYYYWNARW